MLNAKTGISLLLMASLALGCTSQLKGTGIGAAVGAGVGTLIGNQYGSKTKGAIIGAAVGGTAGNLIGRYMDKQAAEMKAIEGAKVERNGEHIRLTFDSGILFATNKSDLQSAAVANVSKLAGILNSYPDTKIIIEGHTDATGSDSYNQTLSEKRAASVAAQLVSSGISSSRYQTIGYGETVPVASNDTEDGKRLNRRVEIIVVANDELKRKAENGELKL